MVKLSPYVRFNDGKCKEAMNFYKDCFGGKLEMSTIGSTPMASEMGADKQDYIMHSTLTKDDWVLMGSDMFQDKAVIGDNVGITYQCESDEEIKRLFEKLAEDGGSQFMPLDENTFWGATFGMVTDKYGVEWQLNFQKTPPPQA
jgi:PhnB protein